jgi:hypothetical protein
MNTFTIAHPASLPASTAHGPRRTLVVEFVAAIVIVLTVLVIGPHLRASDPPVRRPDASPMHPSPPSSEELLAAQHAR